jgi:transposase
MDGQDARQEAMFSHIGLEDRVPQEHPLRRMLMWTDEALTALDGQFNAIYAQTGRESIPPERLLRALLLQVPYSIRSERQLMEQLHFDLLFRWFVGVGMDDKVWDVAAFTENRDRLLDGKIAQANHAEFPQPASPQIRRTVRRRRAWR